MKYKIGVYGSAAGDLASAIPLATEVGKVLGKYADSVIVITGACPGLPYVAAKAAAESGVEIYGFASARNVEEQQAEYPEDDLSFYKKLIYVPEDFAFADKDRVRKKYRNVISTATCDAAIVISGRWGTLNEFTNLIDFQKLVGVLLDSGGIADELLNLSKKITKAGQGQVIFDKNPEHLVRQILDTLSTT